MHSLSHWVWLGAPRNHQKIAARVLTLAPGGQTGRLAANPGNAALFWSSLEQDLGLAAGEAAGQGQAHLWPGAPADGERLRAGLGEGKKQRTELSFLS